MQAIMRDLEQEFRQGAWLRETETNREAELSSIEE